MWGMLISLIFYRIRAFERQRLKGGDTQTDKSDTSKVFYRITQEGAECLISKISGRKFEITQDELMFLTYNNVTVFENIAEKFTNLRRVAFEEPILGFLVFYVKSQETGKILEVLVVQKFKTTISVMASKEHLQGLKIKYESSLDFLELNC